jgi:hypothetical protein
MTCSRTLVVCALVTVSALLAERVEGQAEYRDSVLVAYFSASTLGTAAFGSELAVELERHLSATPDYAVVTPPMLIDLLPPSVAETLWHGGVTSRTPLTCLRARQVAFLVGASLVVCGTVTGLEDGGFQVLPIVISTQDSRERMLPPLEGTDAGVLALGIVNMLRR